MVEHSVAPRKGSIADVPGIRAGQVEDPVGLTGITVVLSEQGACGGVSVIGGAPGTRETDLLRPGYTVDRVHAVFLTGGSAFGLNAAEGIVRYLEERGIGFDIGVPGIPKVPLVPGAVIFDLGVGNPSARPTPEMAYAACRLATASGERGVASGSHGAGIGATVGKWFGAARLMRGGVGTASARVDGHTVGVITAVNAVGDVVDPGTGKIVAGAYDSERKRFCAELLREGAAGRNLDCANPPFPLANTTIAVVATDAALTKEECSRVALMATAGIAQSIRPAFTPMDGDTVFVLSTGAALAEKTPPSSDVAGPGQKDLSETGRYGASRTRLVTEVGSLAQVLMGVAILDAVRSATGLPGIPAACDVGQLF